MNLWNYGIYIDRLALSLRGGGGGGIGVQVGTEL